MAGHWMSRYVLLTWLVVAAMMTGGCELAAGIFKAGVWVGVLMVVVVIAIIGYVATRARG
jgi:hypothetical protein